MGQFDPSSFLNATIDQPLDTKIIPCPEGEYTAMISGDPEFRTVARKDGSGDIAILQIKWDIQSDIAKAETSRNPLIVRQEIMMDTTEGGGLDLGKGKNIGLGRLREAVGMNKPGVVFSFRDLPGKMATVKVTHRTGGEKNPDAIYDEIRAVAPLSR
jgi:hypothetical protein